MGVMTMTDQQLMPKSTTDLVAEAMRLRNEAEALRSRARLVVDVPLRIYEIFAGPAWHPAELVSAQAVYPFDALEVEFSEAPVCEMTAGGETRLSRALYAAARVGSGNVVCHLVYAGWHAMRSVDPLVWSAAHVVIDPVTGEVRYSGDDPNGPGGVILSQRYAATLWRGLVSLSAAMTACRSEIDVTRVDPSTRAPYTTRQARRAAEREGVRETYVITLRPGVTLRRALAAVRAARREIVRSRPRRHIVRAHAQRYRTREGLVTRSVSAFVRGGHLGGAVTAPISVRRLSA